MKDINKELVAGSSVSLSIISPSGLEEALMPGAKSGGKLGQPQESQLLLLFSTAKRLCSSAR